MNACSIPLETLLDYAEGRLSPARRAALQRHLDTGCPACAAQAAAFPALTAALAQPFEAPSPDAVAAAAGVLKRRRRPPLTQWLAHLVAPTPPPGALAAVRGGAEPVLRLFETDAHAISLWSEPGDAGYYLICQVRSPHTGQAMQPLWLQITPDDGRGEARAGVLHQDGEAHVADLPPGAYRITLCLEAGMVHLEGIALPELP